MRKVAMAAAILTFACVALLAVRLGVRAHLRSYQIAAERQRQERIREHAEAFHLELAQSCPPEWVYFWCDELRRRLLGWDDPRL